ncbi:RES family NAD+ phosphorylase [Terriglobus sp.]|uniref:RES family NAD+ phosphorylase n=1 Tax=Terriglobus sp. TaxID=1889013 RepID=UPI003B00FF86
MTQRESGRGSGSLLHLWRISEHSNLSGLGAEFSSARWHTEAEGKRLVYLSEATASAILEVLVNLEAEEGDFPSTYQLLGVSTLRPLKVLSIERNAHTDEDLPAKEETQALGDAWLASGESALARVPAAVAPYTWNYLLNPKHPDAAHVKITSQRRLPFDPRLFHVRS